MEFVSVDTNIWIDFSLSGFIDCPFRLDFVYVMWEETVDDEIQYPAGLRDQLLEKGLMPVKITTEEFYLAEEYGQKYPRLSIYDRVALAIAKNKGIPLLTGDGAMRKAGKLEGVDVMGTIRVIDLLREQRKITDAECRLCLSALMGLIGKGVRLPADELRRRLSDIV